MWNPQQTQEELLGMSLGDDLMDVTPKALATKAKINSGMTSNC